MAHTIDALVAMQREADEAHARVQEMTAAFSKGGTWSEEQNNEHSQAWREWRERAEEVQQAITEYAAAEDKLRYDIETDVKRQARHTP
jgi:uncharacterized coiled-coil DUF342 family protein